jgi:hypothetical protein
MRTLANRLVGILHGCLRTLSTTSTSPGTTNQTNSALQLDGFPWWDVSHVYSPWGAAMDGRTCVRTTGSHRCSKYSLRVVSSGATNATGHAGGSEAWRAGLRRMR